MVNKCVISSIQTKLKGNNTTVNILITVQRDATQSSLFIILQVHSTCFGCQTHPSSGVHKTVTTASGTGRIFCAATSLQPGQAWPRILDGTQNCNYSLRYWPYFLCSYLPPTWPSLTTLEGGSCTKNTASTGGCSFSFVYS